MTITNEAGLQRYYSPIQVILPRKTKADKIIRLNLNVYRNLHYRINNDSKVMYNILMMDQLTGVKLDTPITISWQLQLKGQRIVDSMNIYSIVSKFFLDALVQFKCIEDDSDKYIRDNVFKKTQYNCKKSQVVIDII